MKRFYIIIKKYPVQLVYAPLALHWVIILTLSSIPGSDYIPTLDLGDKVDHFAAFFVLSIFLFTACSIQAKFLVLNKYPGIWTIIIGVLYGMMDEIHQIFIPGRYCDILDLVADILGILLGLLLMRKLFPGLSVEEEQLNSGTRSK